MASKDLHSLLITETPLIPTSIGGATNTFGNSIDTLGKRSVEFIMVGLLIAIGDFTLFLQDSPDDSVFTTVTQEFLLGTVAGTKLIFTGGFGTTSTLGYIGKQRFVKPVVTSSGAGTAGDILVLAVLDSAIRSPINPNVNPPI